MVKKINSILMQVLEKVAPPRKDLELIENSLKDFLSKFKKKINAEIFVGGSFAKKTVIKKNYYDLDVFVRFDKKCDDEEMFMKVKKALSGFSNVEIIHGSREYFRIKISPDFFIEIIPVLKVKNSKEARNITDLSYSHVNYINRKVKSKKVLDDIKIAKAFCHAQKCYGAESYIGGFSGYSLELLIYYYGSFIKFLKEMSKVKVDKLIIDIEKFYKPKKNVLIDINTSKLASPIILIDPTFKGRNVLAALREETFKDFQKAVRKFLKNPSIKFFETHKINYEKIQKDALKNKNEFVKVTAKTTKQKGDVAGTKLLKFYKHLLSEIKRFYNVKKSGFEYGGENGAMYYFVVKKKKFIIYSGPKKTDKKNIAKFKKEHRQVFEKGKKLYSKESVNLSLKEFIKKWEIKYKKKIKQMSINELKI